MPLYKDAEKLIRANLESWKRGIKPPMAVIGSLTQKQLDDINADRAARPQPMESITAEIVFIGKHVYRSRCEGNGYSIDEVIEQIVCALHEEAVLMPEAQMTTITRTTTRRDKYGNDVRDTATFECSQRKPRPELFSVCPKGDKIKPKDAQKGKQAAHNATCS